MGAICELLDPKVLRVLSAFVHNKDDFFHLNKLSKTARVPLASTFRIVNRLVAMDVVETTRIDSFKIYRLARNKKAEEICGVVQ